MSSLEKAFKQAQQDVRMLPVAPGRINQLRLYGLLMQATEGDVTGKRPGFSDFEGRSRWDAWQALAGTAPDEAMAEYIRMIDRLKSRAVMTMTRQDGVHYL